MQFVRYLCILPLVAFAGCLIGPEGAVFIPWALCKAGAQSLSEPHHKSSSKPPPGASYENAIPVKGTATRAATIAFEDDWTYRDMKTFHDGLPPLVDYSPKVQRVTERRGKKVFDVVTPPCPRGNVHIWYFDITGTPLTSR
jgi:hypothetical protein